MMRPVIIQSVPPTTLKLGKRFFVFEFKPFQVEEKNSCVTITHLDPSFLKKLINFCKSKIAFMLPGCTCNCQNVCHC